MLYENEIFLIKSWYHFLFKKILTAMEFIINFKILIWILKLYAQFLKFVIDDKPLSCQVNFLPKQKCTG